MGNAFAAVREAEEDDEIELVECVIDLDWEKLETSIEDAIRSNRILKDESDFFFVSDDADTVAQYRQLLAASKENPLYTVDYKFKKKDLPDKTSIQLFVRRDGNAEVAYDDRSWEAELMDGDEDQEFLTATPAQATAEQGNDVSGGTEEGSIIGAFLAGDTTAHWLKLLEAAGYWCSGVYSWDRLLESGQFKELNLLLNVRREGGEDIFTTRCPIRFGETPFSDSRHAPALGEHTAQIIAEFGLDREGEIA